MRVKILETGEIRQLEFIDVKTGLDATERTLAACGGFDDGEFTPYDDYLEWYTCPNRYIYDWWKRYLRAREVAEKLLHQFRSDYCEEVENIELYKEVEEYILEYLEMEFDTVTEEDVKAKFRRILREHGIEVKHVENEYEFGIIHEKE